MEPWKNSAFGTIINAMIRECISYVEEILREKGKLGDR